MDKYKQAADTLKHKCEGLEAQLVALRKVGGWVGGEEGGMGKIIKRQFRLYFVHWTCN